jgi:hypothetical protein
MEKIIVYPNFAGVDFEDDDNFNSSPTKNIDLNDLIVNEKFKEEKYFSSVEKKKYLEKMKSKIDELPPILVIKNPLLPKKYSILDGHHRFQLFKKLKKESIPAKVLDYDKIFIATKEYGTKNNDLVRLDKVIKKDFDLEKYFNTDLSEEISEKWSEKYKRSIDCNNPKGFSQRAHCQGKKKKTNESQKLEGGLADNKSLEQVAKKHKIDLKFLKNQLDMGLKIEKEHTNDKTKAQEIALDHLWEDPKYYTKLKKVENKESMGADSAGAFEGPIFGGKTILKKDITKIHNFNESEEEVAEATDASSAGSYDVPLFGGTKGRKNPLSIGGIKSIKSSRAVKDKNFPKWGGPNGVFIKIKEKCKKYPYCNQGDINALELLEIEEIKTAIESVSKKTGIPKHRIEMVVLNEINQIFI